MGILSKPDTPAPPPPPPPLPPAANPQTIANGAVQAVGANAKARAAVAAGGGNNGTNLTGGKTGSGPTAKAQALGDTGL